MNSITKNLTHLMIASAFAMGSSSNEAQAASSGNTGNLKVVHGITGDDLGLSRHLPVDVEVDGVGCILTHFTFGSKSDWFELPAGAYDIKVRLSDGKCTGTVAVDAPGVPLQAGEYATVIAHLTEDNKATATKFTNDLSASPSGEGRFVAHHTAAAGAVDIDVFGFRKSGLSLSGVTNGLSGGGDLERGFYVVAISPAGGHPISWDFIGQPKGKTVLAYAVGNVQSGTFQLIVDIIAQKKPSTFELTVIHGITGKDLGLDPELPVDVSVSGLGCVLTDFRFSTITDELTLPAGTYDIQIRLSDGSCTGALAVDAPGVPFTAGENATVIAHLDEKGGATATKFVNDLSKSQYFRGRATVHHTAEAGAVDIRFKRSRRTRLELNGVTNGLSGGDDLFLGIYRVTIAPAGGRPIFRDRLPLPPATTSLVYAVGSVDGGTFQLLVDTKRQR